MLTAGIITKEERNRFIGVAEKLTSLSAAEINDLTVEMPFDQVLENKPNQKGIF